MIFKIQYMIFKKVLALLNKREKFQVNFLIISFLVAYCFEVISFGLMIPLFSKVILNNNSLMSIIYYYFY